MSLLQDMKAINETTQERVNEHVTAIIDELKPDRQQQIMGQESAKADLDDHERDVRAELRDLEQQLTRAEGTVSLVPCAQAPRAARGPEVVVPSGAGNNPLA